MERAVSTNSSIGQTGARDRMTSRRNMYPNRYIFRRSRVSRLHFSPPSLMDDVDAVQAQIARNMVQSGDWVTARPLLNDRGFLQGLRRTRRVSPHSCRRIRDRPLLGHCSFRSLGIRQARDFMPACVGPPASGPSYHPYPATGRNADLQHRFGSMGIAANADEEERHPRAQAAVIAASLAVGLLTNHPLSSRGTPENILVKYRVFSQQPGLDAYLDKHLKIG
jgi:hypothetical protein